MTVVGIEERVFLDERLRDVPRVAEAIADRLPAAPVGREDQLGGAFPPRGGGDFRVVAPEVVGRVDQGEGWDQAAVLPWVVGGLVDGDSQVRDAVIALSPSADEADDLPLEVGGYEADGFEETPRGHVGEHEEVRLDDLLGALVAAGEDSTPGVVVLLQEQRVAREIGEVPLLVSAAEVGDLPSQRRQGRSPDALDVRRTERKARRLDLLQEGQRVGEAVDQGRRACCEALGVGVAEMDGVVPGREGVEQCAQLVPAGPRVAAVGHAEKPPVEVARVLAVREATEE